jgi:hypothetical protein
MKAVLIYYQKRLFQERYIMEMTIHDVGHSIRYPDGIKYGFLLFDMTTGRRVIFDNHHPKGPHIHLEQEELPYLYQNDEQLIEDFKTFVLKHMGIAL